MKYLYKEVYEVDHQTCIVWLMNLKSNNSKQNLNTHVLQKGGYICQIGQQPIPIKIRIGNKLVITVVVYFVYKTNCRMATTNAKNTIALSAKKSIKLGHALPQEWI